MVLPLIFYHGRQSPYPYSTYLLDLFKNPDLARKVWHNPCHLIDVTTIDDEEIKSHKTAAVFEMIQKHIFCRDILPIISELAMSGLLSELHSSHRYHVLEVVKYVIEHGEVPNNDQLIETFIEALPNERGGIMTTAEYLRKEGIAQGMEQGIEQGVLQTARKALQAGADIEFVAKITGLAREQVCTLQAVNDKA